MDTYINRRNSSRKPLYIIAELGCEHLGNIHRAKRLIDAAKDAGAIGAKLQLFYQDEVGDKMWEQLCTFALTSDQIDELSLYAQKKGIDLLCSAFGMGSLRALHERGHNIVKVPSVCNQYEPYIQYAVKNFDHVLVSTGMLDEDGYNELLDMASGYCDKLKILHCVSAYPAPLEESNMSVLMNRLKDLLTGQRYLMYHGFSDHSKGHTLAVGAVAMGVSLIEKHLTLPDRSGPDGKMAATPEEFKELVKACSDMYKAFGTGDKRIMNCERKLLWRKIL